MRQTTSIILTKSEKYFVNDLYQLIISSASDPVIMMEKLSTTLREFIGAKEIILFECQEYKSYRHHMISHVKVESNKLKAYFALADYTHTEIDAIEHYDLEDTGRVGELLGLLDFSDVSIIPINSAIGRIGCMHIFGALQEELREQMLRLLGSIRPLIGVILQNYQLFHDMDKLLQERTKGLDSANQELANLINTVPDLIVITDIHLNIIQIFNYESDNYYFLDLIQGSNFNQVINRGQYEKKIVEMARLKENDICALTEEIHFGAKVNYLENRIKRTGEHYLHIIRNITESVVAENQIIFMNQYDQLTGLYNRSMFYQLLNELKEKGSSISVMLVDMNGLKLLNETMGFSEGDNYLQKLAKACQWVLPPNASLARVGDDEIAFIVPDANDNMLRIIVSELNKEVETLNATSLKKFPLSISMGYYMDSVGDKDHEYIFNMAEMELNQDKLLHAESKKSAIVRTLTKALEVRDFITEGHADRMESLLETFAQKKDFSASDRVKLRLFGKFHDIGKVGISDNILFKPARLTEEEMSEMMKHSEIGYRIALTAADLHSVADLILKHHERYDGTGYPIGLVGEAIPVDCRILAIVDAYDAMTNNRPYRKALSKAYAIEELIRFKGTQFDPDLVDFFIKEVLGAT